MNTMSNFELLKHAKKVTPNYPKRVEYLRDTIATLREYKHRARKNKIQAILALINTYSLQLEQCLSKLENQGA